MKEIEDWVYNPTSEKRKVFTINSISLRKAVFRQVNKIYIGTGVFFSYDRSKPEAAASKSKNFKQTDFLRGFAKKNVAKD